jgi:3-dehydroquinate synthase II
MGRERIWVAPFVADPELRRAIVSRARRRGFHRFVLVPDDRSATESGDVVARATVESLWLPEPKNPAQEIRIHLVTGPPDLDAVLGRRSADVAVRFSGEVVIPLENLLAGVAKGTRVWVFGARPSDAGRFLGALERGADAVVVEVRGPEEIDELDRQLEEPTGTQLSWESVPVSRADPAGLGDRVIVDTTSLLEADEGLLVGSAAAFLVHVRSEAVGSRYTRPRPFRVNAGAPHSYTLLGDGSTRYLSELEAGDALVVTRPEGPSRVVRVGRLKIERRPLLLVEVARAHQRHTIFLQDAETVRLSSGREAVAVTDLARGQLVWGAALPAARHMGAPIDERVEER